MMQQTLPPKYQAIPPEYQYRTEIKPTWELAWGLFWRMLIIQAIILAFAGITWLIVLLLLGVQYL